MTRWSTILHIAPLLHCNTDKSICRKIRYTPPCTGFPKTPISEGLDFYSGLCAYKVYIAHVSDLKIVHKRQFTFPSKFLCRARQRRYEVQYCTLHLCNTDKSICKKKSLYPSHVVDLLKSLFRKASTSSAGYVLIKFHIAHVSDLKVIHKKEIFVSKQIYV